MTDSGSGLRTDNVRILGNRMPVGMDGPDADGIVERAAFLRGYLGRDRTDIDMSWVGKHWAMMSSLTYRDARGAERRPELGRK